MEICIKINEAEFYLIFVHPGMLNHLDINPGFIQKQINKGI